MEETFDTKSLKMNDILKLGLIKNKANGVYFPESHEHREKLTEFTKCYFRHSLEINQGDNGHISLKDCFVANLQIYVYNASVIEIENCNIRKLEIHGQEGHGRALSVEIRGVIEDFTSKIDEVSIDNCQVYNSHVSNTLLTKFTINKGLNSGSINFDNIYPIDENKLKFQFHESNLMISYKDCAIADVSLSKFTGSFSLANSNIGNEFSIQDCSGQLFIKFDQGKVNRLSAANSSYFNLTVNQTSFERIDINRCNPFICSITSSNYQLINSREEIKNQSKIGRFFLIQTAIKGFKLNGYIIEQIQIIESTSTDSFELANSSLIQNLTVIESNLKDSEFRNFSFLERSQLTLKNSNIADSKFNTVNWPNNHKLIEDHLGVGKNIEGKIQDYLSLKESYRQLKVIAQSASNRFDALNFQAHEQRIQMEIFYLKMEYLNFALLWTNYRFNNFGLSYVRPLVFLLLFHLIFFSVMNHMHSQMLYPLWFTSDMGFNANSTVNAVADYFSTLLPVHTFVYLKDEKGWAVIIDLLMRISSGYFIFYFISATRKFHSV